MCTVAVLQVKYSSDQRQMKGRRSVILDTPELRHVKETQNNISMVKYHEDFEKTKGRGFTPVVDDPITERVRKNAQVVSDAAYKGVHPHIVEMDRRPGIIVGKLLNNVAIQNTVRKIQAFPRVLHYNREKLLTNFIFTLSVKFVLNQWFNDRY
ncbi:UNVERIFIED_CONTAM: hypothetical protein H355_001152 [Colinus virginianus]|nr:hypothetical protein H355_001152 [Colinus virginianus]